jgi:hypothetical protein
MATDGGYNDLHSGLQLHLLSLRESFLPVGYGWTLFGIVYMTTDPVSQAKGKIAIWIYGLLIDSSLCISGDSHSLPKDLCLPCY